MPFPCTCSVSPWGSNQVMVQSTSLTVRLQCWHPGSATDGLCGFGQVTLALWVSVSLLIKGDYDIVFAPHGWWWVEVGLRHNSYLKVSWVLFWCIFLSPGAVLGFLGRDLKLLKDLQQNTFPSLLFLFILLKNSFLFLNRTKKHQWKTLFHSKAFLPWALPFLFSQRLGFFPPLKLFLKANSPIRKKTNGFSGLIVLTQKIWLPLVYGSGLQKIFRS